MDKIVASAQHGQVFVMYDIACNLHKHLQVCSEVAMLLHIMPRLLIF